MPDSAPLVWRSEYEYTAYVRYLRQRYLTASTIAIVACVLVVVPLGMIATLIADVTWLFTLLLFSDTIAILILLYGFYSLRYRVRSMFHGKPSVQMECRFDGERLEVIRGRHEYKIPFGPVQSATRIGPFVSVVMRSGERYALVYADLPDEFKRVIGIA